MPGANGDRAPVRLGLRHTSDNQFKPVELYDVSFLKVVEVFERYAALESLSYL